MQLFETSSFTRFPIRRFRLAAHCRQISTCPRIPRDGGAVDRRLLYPRKRTLLERVGMSALCQQRKSGLHVRLDCSFLAWQALHNQQPRSKNFLAIPKQSSTRMKRASGRVKPSAAGTVCMLWSRIQIIEYRRDCVAKSGEYGYRLNQGSVYVVTLRHD